MANSRSVPHGSSIVLEDDVLERLSIDLHRCVCKNQLVKAKFILKGLSKEDKCIIVSKSFDGNASLFVAAQQGQVHFLNYLLDECAANIEQRGVYEVQEDRSRHKVTPLWCAAVANKMEVVKSLIRHNADVNATSDTQSTPVRSACYMTNIDVVKFLVDNGADIHKPNINGGTCLINSVQSVDLCRFLIEKSADINAQDNSGNLALHYAIREGRMETVKLLLKHNSDPYVKNDFGDDAIQTASVRGYQDILEHLLQRIKPPLYRVIEAYELMATNFVDEKHDLQKAIEIWRKAMEMRYQDVNAIICKPCDIIPNSAYQCALEAKTLEDLEEIVTNPDLVYMQALLIRERILGPDHKDTIFGLMYRGAVYADTHRYQRCVDLWRYAFTLRHEKQEVLNHECLFTLQALCKLFWEIYEEHAAGYTSENVCFDDVFEVYKMTIREVEVAQASFSRLIGTSGTEISQIENLNTIQLLVLHLIHLLSKLEKSPNESFAFKLLVHKLVKLNVRANGNKTLLHLAVNEANSYVNEELYSSFPSMEVVSVLIECGANVDEKDDDGSTSLHDCISGFSNAVNLTKSKSVIICVARSLIEHGAHVDATNKAGISAEKYANSCMQLNVFDYITLKCLAARAVKQNGIFYEEVPLSLIDFIQIH